MTQDRIRQQLHRVLQGFQVLTNSQSRFPSRFDPRKCSLMQGTGSKRPHPRYSEKWFNVRGNCFNALILAYIASKFIFHKLFFHNHIPLFAYFLGDLLIYEIPSDFARFPTEKLPL